MKTLVIGGTGQVGSHVVKGLVGKGASVRVLSRSKDKASSLPAGVELVTGDLNDPMNARAAFQGVEAVFMANPVAQTEANEGICGVALAREAGVKRFVYMSVHNLEGAPLLPHFGAKIGVEAAVRASGMTWTILRPNNFFQNDYWFQEPVTKYGLYPQPIGDVGLHRVDTRDIADAAVNALTASGFGNKAYVLSVEGIGDRNEAERWPKAELWVAPAWFGAEGPLELLVGARVEDAESGAALGKVVGLDHNGAQDLVEIDTVDADGWDAELFADRHPLLAPCRSGG